MKLQRGLSTHNEHRSIKGKAEDVVWIFQGQEAVAQQLLGIAVGACA
jgi:hypothetical protein